MLGITVMYASFLLRQMLSLQGELVLGLAVIRQLLVSTW